MPAIAANAAATSISIIVCGIINEAVIKKHFTMLVPFIALIVVIAGVIIYLVMQSGRKTKDTGNK